MVSCRGGADQLGMHSVSKNPNFDHSAIRRLATLLLALLIL